jgi:hypothetical protein
MPDTSSYRDEARASVLQHRELVIRRLLAAGIAPRLLAALIPEWTDLLVGPQDRVDAA